MSAFVLFLMFLLPEVAWAAKTPSKVLTAWSVVVWAWGALAVLFGGYKLGEWLLKQAQVLKDPLKGLEAKLDAQTLLIEQITKDLGPLFRDWDGLIDQVSELQQLHQTPVGDRPAWWCAVREDAFKKTIEEIARIREVQLEAVTNQQKTIGLLRGLLREARNLTVEEEL